MLACCVAARRIGSLATQVEPGDVLVGGGLELASRARCPLPNAHTHTMVAEVRRRQSRHSWLAAALTPRDAGWRMLPPCCQTVVG